MPRRRKKRNRQKVTECKTSENIYDNQVSYLHRGQYAFTSSLPDSNLQDTNLLYPSNIGDQTLYPNYLWTFIEPEGFRLGGVPNSSFQLWPQTESMCEVTSTPCCSNYPYQFNYMCQPQTIATDGIGNGGFYALPYPPFQTPAVMNPAYYISQMYNSPPPAPPPFSTPVFNSETISSIKVHQYYELQDNDDRETTPQTKIEPEEPKNDDEKMENNRKYRSEEGYLVEEPNSDKEESEI